MWGNLVKIKKAGQEDDMELCSDCATFDFTLGGENREQV